MIDRENRDIAKSAIEDYLDGKISAFELDDRMQAIESVDSTLNRIIHDVWCYYDDCRDHQVRLSKESWQYFQRLRLILGSDSRYFVRKSKPSWNHWLARVCFSMFAIQVLLTGCRLELVFAWLVSAAGTTLIHLLRRSRRSTAFVRQQSLTPFKLSSQIRCLRRSQPDFQKRRYPMTPTASRNGFMGNDLIRSLLGSLNWVAFSPVVLLLQSLPASETIVVLAESETESILGA